MPITMKQLHRDKRAAAVVQRQWQKQLMQQASELGGPLDHIQASLDQMSMGREWLRRSLYGSVLAYDKPFEPAALDDWDAAE